MPFITFVNVLSYLFQFFTDIIDSENITPCYAS